MKRTKIMVVATATFLLTWLILGTIVYLLSDSTMKSAMSNMGVISLMMIFGWLPSVIVCVDLSERD